MTYWCGLLLIFSWRTSENSVMKLSEKGRKSPRCSLTEHQNGPFKPILASLHRLNPRLERCSYTFSDSFMKLSEKPHPRARRLTRVSYAGHLTRRTRSTPPEENERDGQVFRGSSVATKVS
jgi:hypothetical protein